MSPRSEEFMQHARNRLGAARILLADGYTSESASSAYYATLYAARAALSEEDRYAKTHSGTWSLFSELFVATGRFDDDLAGQAASSPKMREDVDYDAATVAPETAAEALEDAERFVDAVAAMFY